MLDKIRSRIIKVPYTTYKQFTVLKHAFLKNIGNSVFVGNSYVNQKTAYIFKVGVWMNCSKDFMGKKFPLTDKKCWKSDDCYPCGFHAYGGSRDLSVYQQTPDEYLKTNPIYEVQLSKILATGTEKYGQVVVGIVVAEEIKLVRLINREELRRLARRR